MKLLSLLLPLLLLGCMGGEEDGKFIPYKPIYMSYDELRSAVQLEAPKAIGKRGKIYLYGDLLLINEPNKGVHMIDNSNPAAPTQLGFINVPGNVDIAVKDSVLYLDSFVDLVAVKIHSADSITVTKRITNVFQYDPYQMIDDYIYLDVDTSKGVVVGYEL